MVDDEPVLADESQRSWILGLKRDPYLSGLMAGELIRDIARELQANGERELTEAELYLAHFFGASAAIRFLAALDERPDALRATVPEGRQGQRGLHEKNGARARSDHGVGALDRIDSKIVRRLKLLRQGAAPTTRPDHPRAYADP
jgi:plasmid stabilization system protein ParE